MNGTLNAIKERLMGEDGPIYGAKRVGKEYIVVSVVRGDLLLAIGSNTAFWLNDRLSPTEEELEKTLFEMKKRYVGYHNKLYGHLIGL